MGERIRGADGRYLAAAGRADAETAAGTGAVAQGAKRPRVAKGLQKRGAGVKPKWTAEKERIFFRELTIVCNVSAALRAAGMLRASREVYEKRKTDARFRAAWDEALAESRSLLELEMHERARFGDDRPEPQSEVEEKLRAVPTGLAMQLLKLYQGRTARSGAAAPVPPRRRDPALRRALRRELEARLSEFNRRMGGNG
jgi:hypothetical protein